MTYPTREEVEEWAVSAGLGYRNWKGQFDTGFNLNYSQVAKLAALAFAAGSRSHADLLRRCRVYVQLDADMMADISRHAPLDPASQATHDATEYESEKLLPLIDAALSGSRSDTRPCTCHPDDNPPKPCPKRYALSECRAAGEDARDAATRYRVVPGEVVSVTFGDGSLGVCVDGENLLYVHGTKLHVTLGGTVRAAIDAAMGGNDA